MSADGDRPTRSGADIHSIIPLTSSEIHLWLAYCDDTADERLHEAYRELLNPEEKHREQRYYFARDRRRYLMTRALVRTVLSRYVPVHSKAWIFSTNAYGRPEIANAEAGEARLSFNISHTHGLIVLGVTTHRALGVDVENVGAREVSTDIADRYFAPQEVAALALAPPHQRQYRFFEYWTFKESYIKARGMGLSLPLDKFSFHYPDDHAVEIAIDAALSDDSGRWQFWQIAPTPEHLVAICAERAGGQAASVVVRQTVPMISETACAVEFRRTSSSMVE